METFEIALIVLGVVLALVAVVTLAHGSVWAVSPQSSSSANAIGKALGGWWP